MRLSTAIIAISLVIVASGVVSRDAWPQSRTATGAVVGAGVGAIMGGGVNGALKGGLLGGGVGTMTESGSQGRSARQGAAR